MNTKRSTLMAAAGLGFDVPDWLALSKAAGSVRGSVDEGGHERLSRLTL